MWCARCEQDVPSLASPQNRGLICIRCGGKIPRPKEDSMGLRRTNPSNSRHHLPEAPAWKSSAPAARGSEPSPSPSYEGILLPISSFLGYDDWEIEQHLRHIGRRVRQLVLPPNPQSQALRFTRVDSPHQLLPEIHWASSSEHFPSLGRSSSPKRTGQIFLYGGIIFLTCGLVLLVLAYLGSRPELQWWGWPSVVLGQAALLLAILFQSPPRRNFSASQPMASPEPDCQHPLHSHLTPLLSKSR